MSANGSGRELSPPEFVQGLRESFREIKKFIAFVRNAKNAAVVTAVLTGILAVLTFVQSIITARAVSISKKQLEMIDRPWIRDNVQSAGEFLFQNGAISWAVTLNAANVGKTVATEIYPDAKLIAIQGADFIDGPRRQVSELCNSLSQEFETVKEAYPEVWNSSIFPNDTLPLPRAVLLFPKDIEPASVDGGAQAGKSVNPMLIGCIVYHYGNSDVAHHTGFVYALWHNDDPKVPESARVFFSINKTLPKDSIALRKVGEFAD